MCGRARCTLNPQQVARACGIQSDHNITTIDMDGFRPSYNVAPGASMPVVFRRNSGGVGGEDDDGLARSGSEVVIQGMKWGLVPGFTKKTEKPDHFRMFNARSESIREKASFRRLVPGNRCLVAVEGFYEWKKDGSKKQPYYIHFKDQRPLVFAALYDSWKSSNGEILYSFTILTTCSSSCLKWLHDRMPVILGNKASVAEWLGSSASELESVLRPYEGSDLVWYAVTPAIGKISFNGPECVKEMQLKPAKDNTITKFFSKKKDVEGADLSAIIKEESCSAEDSRIKIETEISETPINKKPRDKEDNEWQEECRPAKSRKLPPSGM